jgi:hypothetical protein
MKKHNVVALVGTLALLANLLVPGLVSAADPLQQGTADIRCSENTAGITVTPDAGFDFTSDGTQPAGASNYLYASSSAQYAYNNNLDTDISTAAGGDYIEVNDPRDPSAVTCNEGLILQLAAIDDTTADGAIFESGDTGVVIPLDGVRMVTSADYCPATYTKINNICFAPTALCGAGSGVQATTCAAGDGAVATGLNYSGIDFGGATAWTTYNANAANQRLGTSNTPTVKNVITFENNATNGHGLYGNAGLAFSYGVEIPASKQAGTYVLNLQYTLLDAGPVG